VSTSEHPLLPLPSHPTLRLRASPRPGPAPEVPPVRGTPQSDTPTERADGTAERAIDRRRFLLDATVAGAALVAAGSGVVWAPPADAGRRRVMWGALALPSGGQRDQQQAVRALERRVGRRFDTTHYRMKWDVPLVNGFTRWSADTGHRRQILSWFARTRSGLVSWSAIGDGRHDDWIRRQARSLAGTGWRGYLCFHKEPEDEGDPTDWKRAYGRVRSIFADEGVRRFRWVVCLTAATYARGDAGRWLPRRFDLLGVDGYNRNTCGSSDGWRSFREIVEPAHRFARERGRGLYVIETGCVEGSAGEKADWITQASRAIADWSTIVGVSYNHENTDCNYYVDTSSSALGSFRRMGRRRLFGG
jgi:hypothetical protein